MTPSVDMYVQGPNDDRWHDNPECPAYPQNIVNRSYGPDPMTGSLCEKCVTGTVETLTAPGTVRPIGRV